MTGKSKHLIKKSKYKLIKTLIIVKKDKKQLRVEKSDTFDYQNVKRRFKLKCNKILSL